MERLFAWSGGVLFVASLAFCVYSYLVSWSDGAARGLWTSCAVDIGLLALFGAHHSVFARDSVKHALARYVPQRLLRSVYVWTAALLLIAVCALWNPIGGDLYDARDGLRGTLIAVQLLGLWFIARAVATIDPLELSGIRQVASGVDEPGGRVERLQVVGPYRIVRHPLYFGWLLAVFGSPHMTGDRLAFAALTTLYLVIAIPWEERSLTAVFGREYDRYKHEVRWRLVPYVY